MQLILNNDLFFLKDFFIEAINSNSSVYFDINQIVNKNLQINNKIIF